MPFDNTTEVTKEYIFVGNDFLKALMTFDGFDFMLFDQIWLLIGDAEMLQTLLVKTWRMNGQKCVFCRYQQ